MARDSRSDCVLVMEVSFSEWVVREWERERMLEWVEESFERWAESSLCCNSSLEC